MAGISLSRLEFIMTSACTGHCRHCSAAEHTFPGHVEYARMKGQLLRIGAAQKLESVMCFGGEPLLCPSDVCGIFAEAREAGVPRRQLITNGCFSQDLPRVETVARQLAAAGANDILLSADVFHDECLPFAPVRHFAETLAEIPGLQLRLSPAWISGPEGDNDCDARTRAVLARFSDLGLPIAAGNTVFPAGRAAVELADMFPAYSAPDLSHACEDEPYAETLTALTSLTVLPDGQLALCLFRLGSFYTEDVCALLAGFDPLHDPALAALLEQGVQGLVDHAARKGLSVEGRHRTACGVCRELAEKLYKAETGHT